MYYALRTYVKLFKVVLTSLRTTTYCKLVKRKDCCSYGRRSVSDTVLGDAGECSGVLGEDLLDDQGGLVVVVVEDLKVLAGLDDGRLTEPGDLGPRGPLHLADKLHLGAVGGRQGTDLLRHLGSEGRLALARLCNKNKHVLMTSQTAGLNTTIQFFRVQFQRL